jgi:DNA-binding Lrp family transcriptional regulator
MDEYLLRILRKMAATHRARDPQVFYPVREAAKQLRVPVSAVARVYKDLKKEGILRAVRGSRTTLVESSGNARLAKAKSLIGLPVSYSFFMTLHDYRRFHLEFWKESKRRGFVSNLIFFEDHPQGLEELGETLEESFDLVIWFLPRASSRQAALQLSDRGIPQIRIADGDIPGIHRRYEIRREKALATILNTWQSDAKVKALRIIRTTKYSAAEERMTEQTADELGLEYEHIQIRDDTLPEAVASLCRDPAKGIVLPSAPAMLLSVVAPRAFAQLLNTCRVALPDGPVTSFFDPVSPAPVDLITVDWRSVVKKIVADLITKRAFSETPSAFEAVPQLRVSVRRYVETVYASRLLAAA